MAQDRIHSILAEKDLPYDHAGFGWFDTLSHAMKIVACPVPILKGRAT